MVRVKFGAFRRVDTIKAIMNKPQCLFLLFFVVSISGCASLRGGRLPESLITAHDPMLDREYFLYRPPAYDKDRDWPLIVACHGGLGDSPQAQIKQWRGLADKYGFLVVAPQLQGGGKLEKIGDDERHILAVVEHVRASQSVSSDRVLTYGQGTGALVAFVTAVGAPDTFRALALTDPKFRVEDLDGMKRALDPYQPILVHYNGRDVILGKHVRDSVDWLRSHGANLRADTFGNDPTYGLQRVVEFYEHVIRTEPWVRIRAAPTGAADRMEMNFQLRSTMPMADVHWQFGDGAESRELQPVHQYSAPGSYTVQVTGKHKKEVFSKSLLVRVPASAASVAPNKVP